MRMHFYQPAVCAVLIGLGSTSLTMAQENSISGAAPLSGNLEMPLVSPEQAADFLAKRVVPKSDMPELKAAPTAAGLVKLNVAPVLGHDLPTEKMTPSGFPRADFAVADPATGEAQRQQRHDVLGAGSVIKAPVP